MSFFFPPWHPLLGTCSKKAIADERKMNSSGQLNAKHRELLDLQAQAQARLARTRARFQEGLQDAQEVRANLEWTSKKVS